MIKILGNKYSREKFVQPQDLHNFLKNGWEVISITYWENNISNANIRIAKPLTT